MAKNNINKIIAGKNKHHGKTDFVGLKHSVIIFLLGKHPILQIVTSIINIAFYTYLI